MKLEKLYRQVVEVGIENDPRGKDEIKRLLERRAKKFEKLPEEEKAEFDVEGLKNPYADTRILAGTGGEEVRRILVGIDIDAAEVLLADRLRERGEKIDLVLSHHPIGKALAGLHEVMGMQVDILAACGVSVSAAEALMDERTKVVERRLSPGNHTRAADAATLLGIPLMCAHTPADNMVNSYLQRVFDKEKPYQLSDVLEILLRQPEYKLAARNKVGPKIFVGTRERRAGKVFVDMTGGTSGAKKIFRNIAGSGINTIVGMHIPDDYRDEAKEHHINVVIAGHISSDSLGLNLLFDELSKRAGRGLEFLGCSGFVRNGR
jgi:putative NIF3 family GTP cyclohydrolase 1 type 2